MKGYFAIMASILMLATTAFGKGWTAAPTRVGKTAVYATPANNEIQAIWATQYRMDQQTPSAVLTSDTPTAGVILTAGRGGGGGSMHGGMGSFHGGTSSFHGGTSSFRGGFHRDFDDFHGHHNFHHRDNDFFFGLGLGFGYYPYSYYPYSYYPYSCYPYGYYNSPYSGYYCGYPWYFYPYLSFSW